jgi:ribosomal protein L11 methyltransferase
MNINYLGIHFKVAPVQPGTDILIAMLGEYEFDSFVNTDNGFDAFIKEEDFNQTMIDEIPEMDFTFTYEIEKIEQKNWNAEWESNFHPVFVEDKCCIRASFHEKPENVQLDILIDPKMSFGTGHHDTTWLMSRELFNLRFKKQIAVRYGLRNRCFSNHC